MIIHIDAVVCHSRILPTTYGYRNRDRTIGTLAFVAGSDLFATAVIQRCPANALLGTNTCQHNRFFTIRHDWSV
ncbi:DUF2892 domain-containing protein [Salinadaptatus halalkaliphilus]|uniref:DUF2892 domain-containing protein n=1 Tax=Salinadaptatus halalkaliphilus TaxID=2419781 RepID=A0A4S3TMK2_9EURY|nr:DUF2892 domain-containing protein [Salinadaptatus halalkaliphilus]